MKLTFLLAIFFGSLLFVMPGKTSEFSLEVRGLGSKDIIQDGIRPDELNLLSINARTGSVTGFEIVHARGKSPVKSSKVDGNSFDLREFRHHAKAGDRIVINVLSVTSGNGTTEPDNAILIIPIK